jgi:multiple sugar transport system permease protein
VVIADPTLDQSTARPSADGAPPPVPHPRRRHADTLWGHLFLGPWFIGFFVLTLGPMLVSLYLSMTDFDLLTAPKWVGLDNYVRMFTDDPDWLDSVRVTVVYVVVSVPLQLAVALLVAVLLDRGLRGMDFYRSVFYLPSLLGGSVAVAVLWQRVFGDDGLLNQALGYVGIDGPAWISDPDTSIITLIVLHVWQFGAPMVIFLAGLRQIPAVYTEAATVDGANAAQRFFRVTLPLLSPIVFFNLILQLIAAFQAFAPAFVVSNGSGGPANSLLFYTLYLYQQGFGNFHMGYASAMAWVLFVVVALLTGVNFALSRYWVHYEQ